MRTLRLMPLLLAALSAGCLDMDGFLANEQPLDAYTLPGNTIPANLITPVTLQSGGHAIYGYWVASNGRRPGVTILYCHGNKHHLDHYWDRVMLLHELGVNVFIFDYRSFGRSEGTFSERAMLEDAEAAYAYVRSRPDVRADSIGVYGYSLGNVASIYLTADVFDPLFLVAEAPFASASALTQGSLALPLPTRWLTTGTFDNAERIRRIQTPLLLIHGSTDDFVRYRDNGRVVYENASAPKREVLVAGANHNDIPQTMGLSAYRTLMMNWINTRR